MKEQSESLVSVVISTRNCADQLERCLGALALQTHSEIEVIVVDNHSTDGTLTVAINSGARTATLGPERSAQRNHGIFRMANGRIIGYLDADMIPGPDFVRVLVEQIGTSESLIVPREIILGTPKWERLRNFERDLCRNTVIEPFRFASRDVWSVIGGFDENLTGPEDWDLALRAGIHFASQPSAIGNSLSPDWPYAAYVKSLTASGTDSAALFHDESDLNIALLRSKKAYYSSGLIRYQEKWPRHINVRKQLHPIHRLIYTFCSQGRWRKCLQHPVTSVQLLLFKIRSGWFALKTSRKERVS